MRHRVAEPPIPDSPAETPAQRARSVPAEDAPAPPTAVVRAGDPRRYVRLAGSHAPAVLGVAVATALLAVLIGLLLPRSYEARALVAVTKPQYLMSFDSRFQPLREQAVVVDLAAMSRSITALATGDEVLLALLDTARSAVPPAAQSVDGLRGLLDAAATSDPSLVALRARGRNPEQAADIANAWAEALVARAADVYGQGSEDLAYFEARLAEVGKALGRAEEALVEFQARNELSSLNSRLVSQREAHSFYLSEKETASRLLADVRGFRSQVALLPPEAPLRPADDLTALSLEIKTYNAGAVPIQLQVSGMESPLRRQTGDLQAYLAGLETHLQGRAQRAESRLQEIAPQVLQLQAQVQRVQNESDRLAVERDVAKEAYGALARKLEETRIATQGAKGQVRVASRAVPPTEPAGPGRGFSVLVAGFLGLLLGVAGVVAREWWREGELGRAGDPAAGQRAP